MEGVISILLHCTINSIENCFCDKVQQQLVIIDTPFVSKNMNYFFGPCLKSMNF